MRRLKAHRSRTETHCVRACIVTAAVAALAALFAPVALADSGDSANWAGYAVHGTSFRQVSASWRQPAVACVRGHQTYSAYWVGLGGYNGDALEQIGTEADCGADGRPTLSAWYEMVPAASVPVGLAIEPGDRLQAQVTVTGHRASMWLRDRTRHHAFHILVTSPRIDVSSAEWIVEAPSDCLDVCTTLPLADFGTAVFTAARARAADGRAGTISDPAWTRSAIRLDPASGPHAARVLRAVAGALPSTLRSGGSSFSVAYARIAAAGTFGRRRMARLPLVVHPARERDLLG